MKPHLSLLGWISKDIDKKHTVNKLNSLLSHISVKSIYLASNLLNWGNTEEEKGGRVKLMSAQLFHEEGSKDRAANLVTSAGGAGFPEVPAPLGPR